MTTWTSATVESETWSASSAAPTSLRAFSPLGFSHATHNSLHAFSFGNSDAGVEGWYNKTIESESWTAA